MAVACDDGQPGFSPDQRREPICLPPLPWGIALGARLVHSLSAAGSTGVVAVVAAVIAGAGAWLLAVRVGATAPGPSSIAGLVALATGLAAALPAAWFFFTIDELLRLRAELYEQLHHYRAIEARLRRLAETDDLTGLLNRRAFLERAHAIVALARRYGHPLAVAVIDIDLFKAINDRWGHAVGDDALREVAEALRREARASDLIGRLGGDEFVVLMPMTALAGGRQFAERLRRRIKLEASRPLTVSIGVASTRGRDADLEALPTAADRMLYAAKQAGRDQVYPPPATGEPDVSG